MAALQGVVETIPATLKKVSYAIAEFRDIAELRLAGARVFVLGLDKPDRLIRGNKDRIDTMILATIDAGSHGLVQCGSSVFMQDECRDCLG